jgi:putative transposase
LMPNHFHLLIYQNEPTAMTRLLRGVCTSYSTYFNKKYRRIGPLFHERYKASRVDRDEYLQHISRYIHLNPESYKEWSFSSLPYYLGTKQAAWVRPERILELFRAGEYASFVSDYVSHKRALEEIKYELADS